MKWSYGITTVPQRRNTLFPKTLASIIESGFPNPTIFVDGDKDILSWENQFKLNTVVRSTTIKTYGHWILSLAEIYIREPTADRFAMFQDDFITYKNLRLYLEKCSYPDKGYWNLYTFPSNQSICPKRNNTNQEYIGWYESNQLGKGAVALVFDRDTVLKLLTSQHMVERPMDPHRGSKSVDGGVVTALKKIGYKEYVHNPSLVQHTGIFSSMGNKPHKQSLSFRGSQFNCLDLLK